MASSSVSHKTSRRWCFTEHRVTEFEIPEELPEGVKYFVCQLEKAPETGKLHWQGYAVYDNACRFQGARKKLGLTDSCHMEAAKGNDEQNKKYCTKEDSRVCEFDFICEYNY